jgi:hypothetical protein
MRRDNLVDTSMDGRTILRYIPNELDESNWVGLTLLG